MDRLVMYIGFVLPINDKSLLLLKLMLVCAEEHKPTHMASDPVQLTFHNKLYNSIGV